MEEKKLFPLARKSVSTSRNKVFFFKNCISPMVSTSRKKSLNKRILFQIDRKSVAISENGEWRIHLRIPFY